MNGYKDIVELLLKREDVAPGTLDNEGQTPYTQAAYRGHVEVIGMLQECSRVSYDSEMTERAN